MLKINVYYYDLVIGHAFSPANTRALFVCHLQTKWPLKTKIDWQFENNNVLTVRHTIGSHSRLNWKHLLLNMSTRRIKKMESILDSKNAEWCATLDNEQQKDSSKSQLRRCHCCKSCVYSCGVTTVIERFAEFAKFKL